MKFGGEMEEILWNEGEKIEIFANCVKSKITFFFKKIQTKELICK
jgi:hypothetical protein